MQLDRRRRPSPSIIVRAARQHDSIEVGHLSHTRVQARRAHPLGSQEVEGHFLISRRPCDCSRRGRTFRAAPSVSNSPCRFQFVVDSAGLQYRGPACTDGAGAHSTPIHPLHFGTSSDVGCPDRGVHDNFRPCAWLLQQLHENGGSSEVTFSGHVINPSSGHCRWQVVLSPYS